MHSAPRTIGFRVDRDFRQPHRPERRYDGFGPFTFSRGEYEAAVAEALRVLGDGGSSSGLSRG